MKSLNELRDEMAYEFDGTSWYGRPGMDYFKAGFDAGIKAEQERSQVLVEALKFACGNRCAMGINPCFAREALDEYNKQGEMK